MSLAWIMVALGLGVTAWTRYVPTAEDLLASFQEAQRFYGAEAYDQAVEQYEKVGQVHSALLHVEEVTVTVGEITAPVTEAALYQSGNAYFKMAQEALRKVGRGESAADREKAEREAQTFLERAVEFFERVESEATAQGLGVLAQSRLVTTWYEAKDYEQTIVEAQTLISKYPDSKFVENAMYDIAWSHFEQDDYESSIRAFEALIRHSPTGFRADRALFQIAECYYLQSGYEKAIGYYDQLVARANVYGLTERDLMKMRREKLAGLVDETALELAAKAQLKIGDGFSRLGQLDKATEAFERVITLFSAERGFVEEGYRRLADMYYEKGNLEQSIQTYKDAIDRVRDRFFQARMQAQIARRYSESGRFDEAIDEYEVYIKGYDDVAVRAGFPVDEAEYNIGRAHYDKGQQALAASRRPAAAALFREAVSRYESTLNAWPGTRLQVDLQFNIALCRQFMGDESSTARALEGFRGIISDFPDHPLVESSLFQVARIFYDQQAYAEALKTYGELLRRFPDSPQASMAHFERGVCHRDQGQEAEAVEAFLMVQAGSPLFADARVAAGEILIRRQAYSRTLDIMDEALASAATSEVRTRYLYIKAKAHTGEKAYERAAEDFSGVIDGARDQPRMLVSSLYARGTALLSLGRHGEADRDFERVVEEADDPVLQRAGRRMLGLSLIQQGRELEASRNYEALAAQATDPQEKAEYLLLLAELYHGLKAWEQVVRISREIVEVSGGKPEGGDAIEEKALFLLGDACNRLEDYAALIETYKEALRRYPGSIYAPDMTFALGLGYMQTGRPEEAATEFDRFLERHAGDANTSHALYYLGHIRSGRREFGPAIVAFERLVAEFPGHEAAGDAWFRIGESYFNLGKYEEALRAYRTVADDWPGAEQDDALYSSAWVYMELGRGEEATASLGRLVAEFPGSELAASAKFTIGDYHYNEGRYEEALEAYVGLVNDHPDDELAAEVPKLIADLREAVAFTRFQKIAVDFRQAMANEDEESLRRILSHMGELVEEYPGTETELGVLNNMGITYESLNEWKEAVGVYDRVIARHEEGTGTPDAYQFARQHRDWIVANRL